MKTRLSFKVRKRTLIGWLTWILTFFPLILGALIEFAGFPWATRYILDAAWIILATVMIWYGQRIKMFYVWPLVIWIALFWLCSLLVYVVQYQSVWYYLWGVRNNFRYYVAFFAFAAFLSITDIERFYEFLDSAFWLNLIVSFIQWVLLKINGDYLGGIFGITQGVNGYTNIFILIIVIKNLIFYLDKKESLWNCALKCVVAFLIASMAEIKFFYVEFIVAVALVTVLSNFSWRKFWIIVGAIAALSLFASLMAIFFPTSANLLSFDWFRQEATSNKGYTSSGDLNRLTAISRINELWLQNWGQRLFGLGLGNCDTSTFAVVNTPFYEQYGYMHYTWMTYAIMYLECGWIGLIFYFGFFVLVYLATGKIEKRSEGVAKSYCRMSKIVAICCPLIAIYNASLRGEAAYMIYFALAIPFALERCSGRQTEALTKQKRSVMQS